MKKIKAIFLGLLTCTAIIFLGATISASFGFHYGTFEFGVVNLIATFIAAVAGSFVITENWQ